MFTDEKRITYHVSRIRRETVFILSLRFVPSLQSAFCTDHVIMPIRFSPQARRYFMLSSFQYQSDSAQTKTCWSHDLGEQSLETLVYNRKYVPEFFSFVRI